MPTGPFGEILGTTGTLDKFSEDVKNYKSKVIAPRNPKLMRGDEVGHKLTPSKYLFDMSMDTDQRLASTRDMRVPVKIELLDMGETTHQKFSQVNIDEPLFQPYPSDIYFQNFEPFIAYEVPLILRNNDKVPRLVKVVQAESPYFKVISPNNVGNKVGPGLPTTFRIVFTPDEKKDYFHELVCITEREKFIVPVKAIGARAILDMPDDVHFPMSSVKHTISKTLLVRNIGNKEAKFSLAVEKPFTVSPDYGVLAVNDSVQVTTEFTPMKVGDHKTDLVLHYDTGENVQISLYGAAQDTNVRLDKNSIRIENTFISMANQRTITIGNRTDVIAHFRWSKFPTQHEEDSYRSNLCDDIDDEKNKDTDQFLEECITDPTLRDKLSILTRTFQNRRRLVESEGFLFDDDVISIEPVEGDIWPHSSFEINIVFKPRVAKTYNCTAFCDVTGRETRLPLRIRADGMGPKVQFSYDTLDMGNIFIGSKHTYEIVLANKGDIDAMFSVMPHSSVFGPCFTFNPAEGIIMPDGHQAIQITFKSQYLGDFQEDFSFQVDGLPEKPKILFTGSVIGPTFQFDVPKMKFGTVSYGFLSTKHCIMRNTSLVPMTFNLHVPSDGVIPSMQCDRDIYNGDREASEHTLHSLTSPPKEFTIIPDTGTIPAQSDIRICVNLVSNTIKKYETSLVVDVENVGEDVLSLPISARCIVPNITILSPIMEYGRCFIRHPYEQCVKLHNDTDLPARYEVIPQRNPDQHVIHYLSPKPKGIVGAHSVLDVPLVIQAQKLEELDTVVNFAVFGSIDPPLQVHILCIGEGPVVHISPLHLDWEKTPVLTDVCRTITLSNESLIPAVFTANMVRPHSIFRISPTQLEIPPQSTAVITVTANLNDCVRFQDKLKLVFHESQVRTIPLVACGQGTTIVSVPELTPIMDLGPNFSNRPLKKVFLLTNHGRRHQQLVWSTEGFPLVRPRMDTDYNPLDMKYKYQPPPPVAPSPIFSLTPCRMDLAPDDSITLELDGFVDMPMFVKERLLCHAIIGRQGGKELIMKVDVKSDFISPLIEFSSKTIFFRVDKDPDVPLELQTKDLLLTNISSLPLTMALELSYPFQLLLPDDVSELSQACISLIPGQAYPLKVQFDPAYKSDSHIRTVDEVLNISYKEHPHMDYVALRGEVFFPNLEFEKSVVDFGCILNDTEVTRYINVTNNSPMEVRYKWSFLIGNTPCTKFNTRQKTDADMLVLEHVEGAQDGVQEVGEEEEEGEHTDHEEEESPQEEKAEEEKAALDNRMTDVNVIHEEPEQEYEDDGDDGMEKGQREIPEKETDRYKIERLSLSSASSESSSSETPLLTNRALAQLLDEPRDDTPLGIEEVFDILPLYGTLQPGDTEQVTLTFFGHADIWGEAKAICEVEGGPMYEVILKGEASLVDYKFSTLSIDYGKQMYDAVAIQELTLTNTGKVGFDFCTINMNPDYAKKPMPGCPVVIPHTGYIAPLSNQTLKVKYLPGVPEKFTKTFHIQVAHFEATSIEIFGEGVFPRISLDLPRVVDDKLSAVLKEAKDNLTGKKTGEKDYETESSFRSDKSSLLMQSHVSSQRDMSHRGQKQMVPSDLDIQMEVERMNVKTFALQQYERKVSAQLDMTPPTSNNSRDTDGFSIEGSRAMAKLKTKKPKARLPDYLLDFGYVVLGTVRTHIIRVTNTGYFPASFQIDRSDISSLGFYVDLDRVKQLPGAPDHETIDFVVSFDPRGANLSLGFVESSVTINVMNGPQIILRLKACVTMPDLMISDNTLDFDYVKCGECKVITVQLHNHQHVRCEWNSLPTDKDKLNQVDKHLPMHLRRKLRNEKKPVHFEVIPATGALVPGQRMNVQVKFMPSEEKFYEQRIPIRIAQSSQRILLLCRGQGSEPRLEFEHNLVEFGPVLPHSSGDEREVIIKNPCTFPIEVYNLEFDKAYLEEERVLRLMRGWDDNNTILLPPRYAGEKIAPELTDFYEEQVKRLEEQEQEAKQAAIAAAVSSVAEADSNETQDAAEVTGNDDTVEVDAVPPMSKTGPLNQAIVSSNPDLADVKPEPVPDQEGHSKDIEIDEEKLQETASSSGVGELEVTPVSAAIARYLGIDLSLEGKAARNRRGIALVVHGAPLSGKTATAVMLAKHYEAALLSIDTIVMDAIANGNTQAGLRARELCAEAARKRAEELRLMDGEDVEKKAAGGLSVEAVAAHTQGATAATTPASSSLPPVISQSVASNRKTISDAQQQRIATKDKQQHMMAGSIVGGRVGANASTEAGNTLSQVASSPPPLLAPIARRLLVSDSMLSTDGFWSCVLSDDLLVDLLAERLQLNDCHRGVVFDGLETLFAQNMYSAGHAILKSLNNRRFLYFITLKLDYCKYKEQQMKEQEEREKLQRQHEDEEMKWLEEMDEDEYDALTEEQKAVIDQKRLRTKKERIKREQEEKAARERQEQLAREEEQRRLEEEKAAKKRGKKTAQGQAPAPAVAEKDAKKAGPAAGRNTSQDKIAQKAQGASAKMGEEHTASGGKTMSQTERPESRFTEKSDTQMEDRKKKLGKDGKKIDGMKEKGKDSDRDVQMTDDLVRDPNKEAELCLMQRFRTYEHVSKDLVELLDLWNRATGQVQRAQTPSEKSDIDDVHPQSGRKAKGKDKKEKKDEKDLQRELLEKERMAREAASQAMAQSQGSTDAQGHLQDLPQDGDEKTDFLTDELIIGVPNIALDCTDKKQAPGPRVLELKKLPTVEEVLDGLGMGPRGPPVPPPAVFAVIPYPVKRRPPMVIESGGHYVFVAASSDDPNVGADDKGLDLEEEKNITPDRKEGHTTPTGGTKGGRKDKLKTGEAKERKRSAGKQRQTATAMRRGSALPISPPPGMVTPVSDGDAQSTAGDSLALSEPKTPKLTVFRWIVPANGTVILRLRFNAEELGQFDQTMNFEIMGTRRRYQLYCRGICAFPSISREPRIVFKQRKKTKQQNEIVHKKFILSSDIFEFGPLLVGKTRDRYKEGRYPENMEQFMITNTSPLEADITFCFLHDSKAETYLLEPPSAVLKPGECKDLTVWAYPKTPGHYEDAVVCCVRENPEPIVFKISCDGVRPELELDKKVFHFDKVLLHRKDTKTIYLRNSTLLPVAWKLSGLENLGDDFSVSIDNGVITAQSEYALNAYFRAMKPINQTKKMIRLEISDEENIMGVVQTESIQVLAEAYDVALDMSFPKGADGGLDFGTIRVFDEAKQTCTMKNKGKYEIAYSFYFDTSLNLPDATNLFQIVPQKGTLSPLDRPTQVQVTFRSKKEIIIRDKAILRCHVIEPNIMEGGDIIASIPIKVTCKAVFSKYHILPVNDISFGSLLVNCKKTRTFTIENRGDFDFKYTLTRMVREVPGAAQQVKQPKHQQKMELRRPRSREGSSSVLAKRTDSVSETDSQSHTGLDRNKQSNVPPASTGGQKRHAGPIRQEAGQGATVPAVSAQSRLTLSAFTIFPAFGIILPNGHQSITVDCLAEQRGRYDEELAIEVADRDPTDHQGGIPYRVMAEACVPSIIEAIGTVFEEHRVCKNLSLWQHSNQSDSCGVYGEDDKKFVFNNVIVGRKAKARFKICNSNKVPCDLAFNIKPVSSKAAHQMRQTDIFEVDPAKAQIASHSFVYATVVFTPQSMQTYSAMFEASIENMPTSLSKARAMLFELMGEGNLPRITITRPRIRNKRGQPLMLFKKTLVGHSDELPLCVTNDGTLPCKVDIDLIDPDGVFTLKPTNNTPAVMTEVDKDVEDGVRRPHTASVVINVNENATFDVIYSPSRVIRSQAHLHLSVIDNQYEDSIISVVGEGYEDDITLENIHNAEMAMELEHEEGNMAEDDVAAAKPNLMQFGDCYVGEIRTVSFTITNHTEVDSFRFQWIDQSEIKFSPQLGHLHAGTSKDISVTFKSEVPKTFTEQVVVCKVCKIVYDKPVDEIPDWDDRIRSVKWVDVAVSPSPMSESGAKSRPSTPQLQRPGKRKIVECDPEPAHTEIVESARSLELLVSGIVEHSKYKCKTESIMFKDTLMFQTRVYEFAISNKGSVQFDYTWQLDMESLAPSHHTAEFYSEPKTASSGARLTAAVSDKPFTIEPEYGTLQPGKKAYIKLKFSPLDVHEYEAQLSCSIANLEKDKSGPVIAVRAKSLMPYCHFELEDSDYLISSRRNPEFGGPNGQPPGTSLNPNTHIIEFDIIGVGVTSVKKFFLLNPTNQAYSFEWVNEDYPDPKQPPTFTCLTLSGHVRSGKKLEVGFQILTNKARITESFWMFKIPAHNISIPFLLVGHTREPDVIMDRSHFNFKALLIGHEAMDTVYLINNEEIPFSFSFLEESCYSAGHSNHMHVLPMIGTLAPKSRLPLNLYFVPNCDKEVSFNLQCKVQKKHIPITLNVKGEGYSMDCALYCEDSTGNKVELSRKAINEIQFGEIEVHEQAMRSLFIFNNGKFNFDYTWEIHHRTVHKEMVKITPELGGVNFGESQKCVLAFCPPCKTSLRGCELLLKISNGPSYTIQVTGLGMAPLLQFSFQKYDFGPQFIHRAGMPIQTVQLRVTNRDKKEISLDCLYIPTIHLHHNFEACVLSPMDSIILTFAFYPRNEVPYRELVTFEINGLSRHTVEILGHGTEMKIEVADPKNKILNLGNLLIGKRTRKFIPIVNNSPAPVSFKLAISPVTTHLKGTGVLSISPTEVVNLESKGGIVKVEVVFAPKARVPQFSEEVMLECIGFVQPLFVIQGSCLGMEISLETDSLPFGAVVLRSQSTRKLVMYNTGDMNGKFEWDVPRFKPDFSITPVTGHIAPDTEVAFDINFHPQMINQDVRYEKLQCFIDGGPHDPVTLTLTGICTGVQPVKEIQHFSTHVRQKETKPLTINNRTNQQWELKPIIDGEYWTGPVTFPVEPQTTKLYELTYYPLQITPENKKHTGSIFFPLPDGTGLLFNLSGMADAPKPNARIARDIPCKTFYTEMLTINNWLKKPQRFRVKIEPLKVDRIESSTTLKGVEYVDAPANAKKEYKLTFHAYKEGLTQAKVTFVNDQTGEYQFYEIIFRATRPGVVEAINLQSPVRQSIFHTIIVENPMNYPLLFSATCSASDILMPPQLNVPQQSEGQFNLEYQPLRVGETHGRIELSCADLGLYTYDLQLKATAAGPETAVYYRTSLGNSQVQATRFMNYVKQKTDYVCRVDNADFHVDRTLTAAPSSTGGTEIAFDITFEPSRLGEQHATVIVSSPIGGEYIFPLIGTCIPPRPQGPIIVKGNSTMNIMFRNVFTSTTPFTFQVDHPAFHLTKNGENIRSRKEHRIVITFDGNENNSRAPVMAKLVVTCPRSAGGNTNVQWVYYLKGVPA